jgi:hypothetical protein
MYIDDKEGWRWSNSANQMVLEGSEQNRFMLDFKILSGGRNKKKMKQQIRQSVEEKYKNMNFDGYKKADLDFAIYLESSDKDYSGQDLDNVQKIVLDALQKDSQKDKDPSWDCLFENDARICRILVWKSKKVIYLNKLFNWNGIIINDNEKQEVTDFLVKKLGYDYFQTAEIKKINDLTFKVTAKPRYSYFKLDNETKKVTLKRDGKTHKFVTKIEGDRLDVYYDSGIDTVSTTISFRIHDPEKPMIMIPLSKLSKFGMIS